MTEKKKPTCPFCGFPVADTSDETCPNCGGHLTASEPEDPSSHSERVLLRTEKTIRYCPMCGSSVETRFKYCPECGEALKRSTERDAPGKKREKPRAASKPQGGRKGAGGGILIQPWHIAATAIVLIIAVVAVILSHDGGSGEMSAVSHDTRPGTSIDLNALQQAERYIRDNPDDPQGILTYANMLYDSQLFEKAIEQYTKYLEKDPDNADARVDNGVCYYMIKNYDRAIAEMERAVKDHPQHQLGKFNLGIVNLAAGNSSRAFEWFEGAIALNPENEIASKARQIMAEAGGPGPGTPR